MAFLYLFQQTRIQMRTIYRKQFNPHLVYCVVNQRILAWLTGVPVTMESTKYSNGMGHVIGIFMEILIVFVFYRSVLDND